MVVRRYDVQIGGFSVQNAEMRERMFTMRLSEDESLRLDRIAGHYGLNAAGLIRMLLKKEERDLGATLVTPKPTKPKR